MEVEVLSQPLGGLDAAVICVGLTEGAELPAELANVAGAGDVRQAANKLTLLRPDERRRVLVVGLGDSPDAESLRVAAAAAAKEASNLDAESIAWVVPAAPDASAGEAAAAIVEGTILSGYRFSRYRTRKDGDPVPVTVTKLSLSVSAGELESARTEADVARIASTAANRARELQNLPPNELTPQRLAERAEEIAGQHEALSVEVLDRAAIEAAGMGGLTAVAQGATVEPRLIALRYKGGGSGPRIGLVGKAVTFDSGGISIKPSAGMHEMKMDMSGGAAVLEAVGAIAELGLEIDLVAAIPSTENMPSGSAVRPGDIITQLNGKTVEVNNTDAEGRMILADALTYCARELRAERLIDLATLTGAVLIALGSTYAGLISNDDEWAAAVEGAAKESGELAWRLPLHADYKKLTTGTVADLTNAAAKREAGAIYAGSFLEEFVDELPWVHLDIAGTAWDTARPYVGSGATGFGVRLLVRLARTIASD